MTEGDVLDLPDEEEVEDDYTDEDQWREVERVSDGYGGWLIYGG